MLLAIGSCTENSELSDVAIIITPDKYEKVELSSGEKERYDLEMVTIHDYVKSLKISSFDRQNGETVLLYEEYHEKNVETAFIFTAPEINQEESKVTLTFEVTDNKGNVGKATREVTIKNAIVTAPEVTGIVLYSPFLPGMADALSLTDVSKTFNLEDSPNPETADIFIESNEDFTLVSWRSNTAAKFIKNNSFNYAQASAMSISSIYQNSTRLDVVNDIQPNDIILVGHGEVAQGVFLVTRVERNPNGVSYMIVNYKGIEIKDADNGGNTDQNNPSDSPDEKI